MKVLPDRGPRPRLLDSAVISPSEADAQETVTPRLRARLRRFLLKVTFVIFLSAVVAFWATHRNDGAAIRKVVAVGTRMLSGGTHPSTPPMPIAVQLNADLIQVTSIALGHPRLAVINGKQVTEGEAIAVHTPTRSVTISLRVLEISDHQVKLSDGTQVVIAHLSKPAATE